MSPLIPPITHRPHTGHPPASGSELTKPRQRHTCRDKDPRQRTPTNPLTTTTVPPPPKDPRTPSTHPHPTVSRTTVPKPRNRPPKGDLDGPGRPGDGHSGGQAGVGVGVGRLSGQQQQPRRVRPPTRPPPRCAPRWRPSSSGAPENGPHRELSTPPVPRTTSPPPTRRRRGRCAGRR